MSGWHPPLPQLTPVYDWKVFTEKLVGENAIVAIDDGWHICFFCDGEGSWDADGVDHEEGCIWIEARYALAAENGTLDDA